jgi:DNA-binding transcriptional regulator WhiA
MIAITISRSTQEFSVYDLPNAQGFVNNNSRFLVFFRRKNCAWSLQELGKSKSKAISKNGVISNPVFRML